MSLTFGEMLRAKRVGSAGRVTSRKVLKLAAAKRARDDERKAVDYSDDPIGRQAAGLSMGYVQIPEEVLIERAHALSAPRTITAEAFGYPAPGRSALDKRQGA